METTSHIFMECSWAKLVWFACPLGIRFEEPMPQGLVFKDWLAQFISNSSEEVSQLLFSVCYSLWFARNKLCFEQLEIPIDQTINKAVAVVAEMHAQEAVLCHDNNESAAISVTSAAPVQFWSPPPSSSYKMNIDAAGPLEGKWGIGVIVRDYTGFVMAAGRWRIDCLNDATLAEAMGLKLGMQFALDLFFRDVYVETDSFSVAAAMNSSSTTNTYLDLIIQDCKVLKDQFSCLQCTHITREINHAANGLAKSVLTSYDKIWIEEIPNCISHFIALDCSSIQAE